MVSLSPYPPARRVLIRPPITPTTNPIPKPDHPPLLPSASPSPPPAQQPLPSYSPPNGVVVVGFIGRRHDDVTQLINRIVDSNVFGSGNYDRPFPVEPEVFSGEEVREWFKCRKISYYHDVEKGILYLPFSSTQCPVTMEGFWDSQLGLYPVLKDCEFRDLQGMLFMFSVCHVIIFIQEGSHFDTQILKQFRILQAAKHAMAPFIRSQTSSPSTLVSHSATTTRTSASVLSSNNPSPGRRRNIANRNTSAITLMSGLGSYTSLFPGQCTPVMLFVFLDDFSDLNPGLNIGESADASLNLSPSLNSSAQPSFPMKGSGSVVVLARPVGKSEGGVRKKLQSSLDTQIRFSIKKCRTLTGSETGHAGSRSGGISISAPLFSLDASKAVALIDLSSNQKGESLEYAIGLVEDVLNGKATPDSLLLESHSQFANKEDILSLKEFIYRQSNILRGHRNLIANTNSGSAASVGMVAVAAAAAAASAASSKTFTSPELPNLEIWLSSSRLILQGILSCKHGYLDEPDIKKRKPRQRNPLPVSNEAIASKVPDSLESAVSYMEIARGLDTKFSTLWCERALPVAKEVYLKELPTCYPTSQHEARLEKALQAFNSMVKGPAVQIFMKKLEDECTSIWSSGRQLCDAVSLTGKPCMHPRHDVGLGSLVTGKEAKPHSSGFVFLHACACGRSRLLQSDPFDFETANIASSSFTECDKLLPTIQLPQGSHIGPIQPSSWSLVRVGGSRYYEPSKGLLQSGFCTTQKFLLKWIIFLEKQKNPNNLPSPMQQVKMNSLSSESKVSVDTKEVGDAHLTGEKMHSSAEVERKLPSENIKSEDKKVNFGRGIPKIRKPFSEVVAGSAASDSGFPPLQSRKQPSLGSEKGTKQNSRRDKVGEQVHENTFNQVYQKFEEISHVHETTNGIGIGGNADGNPFLEIGGNVVPVKMNIGGNFSPNAPLKHAVVYVGFEHECPCGHRFILSSDHLEELGSSYSMPKESHVSPSLENSDRSASKLSNNGGHGKASLQSNGITTGSIRMRNLDKSKERTVNGHIYLDAKTEFSSEEVQRQNGMLLTDSMKDVQAILQPINLDDGGCAFSLLNQSLPIYMNCPHCRDFKNKKDPTNVKFAGTISQLQRIFFVTPPFPVVLATCPIIQFKVSGLPPSVLDREQRLQFSLGCQVILPPESFLSLRLPFVYGVQLDGGSLHCLKPLEHQPELTAWIIKGTSLQLLSKGSDID